MLTLVIIFSITLVAILFFLMYKTGEIRRGNLSHEKSHEFGDKDKWLRHHTKKYARFISVLLSKILFSILLWCFKKWVELNRNLYKSIKKRFPEVGYILGEKPNLKDTRESSPTSSYIADIKEHHQAIRSEYAEVPQTKQDEELIEKVMAQKIKPRKERGKRLIVKGEKPTLDNETLTL